MEYKFIVIWLGLGVLGVIIGAIRQPESLKKQEALGTVLLILFSIVSGPLILFSALTYREEDKS